MLECRQRWLRVPILIERGENVECGEDIGNDEVQVPKGEISSGAYPELPTFRFVCGGF